MAPSTMRQLSCLALALGLLFVGVRQATATLIHGSENVSGRRDTARYTYNGKSYGPFGWDYSYIRSFDGTKLTKHVEVDFLFDAGLGWGDAEKAAYKAGIESGIEAIWNGQYSIRDNGTGLLYPLTVDVATTGPFNQVVVLHPGDGPTNLYNWYENDTYVINAHEFGHMLGLYDEYLPGAIDQYPNPTLSSDGLMGLGALDPDPVFYPRYFQQYLDYMVQLNPTESFSLVQVPEPATWLLLVVGLACLAAKRRLGSRACR
ncbi:MAG: PEP-CTERM sorting domain-containing protein [Planctomycetota bacterium]|nr:MAG: PEP-CTERM sorting domain-containing protein [Planctomycetota bacterium]